jgi:hypothetical protein
LAIRSSKVTKVTLKIATNDQAVGHLVPGQQSAGPKSRVQ